MSENELLVRDKICMGHKNSFFFKITHTYIYALNLF